MDPIEEGLEIERQKIEELAARLAPPETAPHTPTNPLDSDDAKDAGLMVVEMLGAGLRSLLFDRPEKPRPQRRPWRFTSPVQAVAAAPPLRPVAAAPPAEMLPGVQSEPPKASGTPNTEAPLQIPGLSFVGHVNDRPEARDSRRFPVEFMSGHQERINIDVREPISRPPLRGPIIGGSQ